MPIRVAVPLKKNNSQKRQNGNLLQAWFIDGTSSTSNTVKKLFVSDNNTIASIFNETEFTQGGSAGSADQIRILHPVFGSLTAYFFRLDVQKWRLSLNRSGPDQNNTIIPNKSIVIFTKITTGTKTLNLKGSARVGVYQ